MYDSVNTFVSYANQIIVLCNKGYYRVQTVILMQVIHTYKKNNKYIFDRILTVDVLVVFYLTTANDTWLDLPSTKNILFFWKTPADDPLHDLPLNMREYQLGVVIKMESLDSHTARRNNWFVGLDKSIGKTHIHRYP